VNRRVGQHYRGARAKAYFAYQAACGNLGADLDRWKFEPYIRPGDTVVDFGCGAGGLLAGLSAGRKVGVEVNELARSAAQRRGLVIVSSTHELEDGIADVVISNHALEHTLAPFDELRGLHRLLKPGGLLVLWLPLDDWRIQRTLMKDPNHHLYTWTPLTLRNLLEEAGFEVRECSVAAHAWPPFTGRLIRLPTTAFDRLAVIWAVLRKRRQLMALATPAQDRPASSQGVAGLTSPPPIDS
jgi:SAM-dependent methyltransferase